MKREKAPNGQEISRWKTGLALEGWVLEVMEGRRSHLMLFNDTTKANTFVYPTPVDTAEESRALVGQALRIKCTGRKGPFCTFDITQLDSPGTPNHGAFFANGMLGPTAEQGTLDVG